jgi:hypothetical protein
MEQLVLVNVQVRRTTVNSALIRGHATTTLVLANVLNHNDDPILDSSLSALHRGHATSNYGAPTVTTLVTPKRLAQRDGQEMAGG